VTYAKQLSDSLEDYLEAIFHIEAQKQAARAKDIADRLTVSSSSVTGALRLLADRGLVNYAPYDIITLTPDGKAVAQEIVHRHQMLRAFFVRILGIAEPVAEEAACKMEHGISPLVLERMTEFIKFLESCPLSDPRWIQRFRLFCIQGTIPDQCHACGAAQENSEAQA